MITAVDVGATKTLVAQFKNGAPPVNEARFPTPQQPSEFLRDLLGQLERLQDISAISIGIPGVVENGLILRCGNLPWKNFPLQTMLAQHYDCPILIANDADLAGLAEITALSPTPAFGLYITVSTGIGVGLIMNGQLIQGLHRTEAGHMLVQLDGAWQVWQQVASGRAIKEHFHKMARELTLPEQWQWVAERISWGLYSLIPTLQPDVIVFGGGVGGYFAKFSPYLIERLERHLPAYIPLPPLRGAKHAEEAVLYGCYKHAINNRTM